MIFSVHLHAAPAREALSPPQRPAPGAHAAGLLWAQEAIALPLGGGLRHPPLPTGRALLAAWSEDAALDLALRRDERLATGWHVRLEPLRCVGAYSPLPELPGPTAETPAGEPAAVLTLGRLRLRRAVPFLRASNPAERRAVADPAMLFGTALARPPRFVGTFSLWRSTGEMRGYAVGGGQPHAAAMHRHAENPFHRESAFVRFRPYAARGRFHALDGEPR